MHILRIQAANYTQDKKNDKLDDLMAKVTYIDENKINRQTE